MSKEFGGKKVNVQNFCCQNIELVPVIWFKISRKLHQQFKREILLLVPLIHREIGRVLDGGKNIYAYAYIDTKKVNEQFKINRKSDMIYDWMINVIGKKKLYIGCTPNASVMNVWWHICHITSTTRYFSHSLTARALARDSHQIHCQWAYCYRYIVCCVACQWIVLTGNWFFGMEYKWANIYSNTHREKKIVDGALKMCKYDWMAIVHRIACDVNDTVNGWGSGQTRS